MLFSTLPIRDINGQAHKFKPGPSPRHCAQAQPWPVQCSNLCSVVWEFSWVALWWSAEPACRANVICGGSGRTWTAHRVTGRPMDVVCHVDPSFRRSDIECGIQNFVLQLMLIRADLNFQTSVCGSTSKLGTCKALHETGFPIAWKSGQQGERLTPLQQNTKAV